MREVNLGDYITGSDPNQNRIDYWRALAACKANRIHRLYVPDPNPGVEYRMNLLAADKPTSAQIAAGEVGDSKFARFLVDFDLEVIGDGTKNSILSFGSADATLDYAALKVQFGCTVMLDGIRMTNRNPGITVAGPKRYGVYLPPKNGAPTDHYEFHADRSEIDWFTSCVIAESGPVTAVNFLDIHLRNSVLRAENIVMGVWTSPISDGTKTVHVEKTKFYNTNPNSGFGSHHCYIHDCVSFHFIDPEFYDLQQDKFALQHWGAGDPGYNCKFATVVNGYWDASCQGVAIISSNLHALDVFGGVVESRQGFQSRNQLNAYGTTFRHKPALAGSVSSLSTYTNGRVKARDIVVDASYVGAQQYSVCAIDNNNGDWDIDGIDMASKAPYNKVSILASSNTAPNGSARVKARNMRIEGYRVPDVDYAAGVRSAITLLSGYQGSFDVADSVISGDGVLDRGGLTVGGIVTDVKLSNVDVNMTPGRGLGLYADSTVADKIKGAEVRLHDRVSKLVGTGAQQRLQLPQGFSRITVAPVQRRMAADGVSPLESVLSLSTDYDSFYITGDVANPIKSVYINLVVKRVSANNQIFDGVYVSDDSDLFVDSIVKLYSLGGIMWEGVLYPAGSVLKLRRLQHQWAVVS